MPIWNLLEVREKSINECTMDPSEKLTTFYTKKKKKKKSNQNLELLDIFASSQAQEITIW